MTLSRRKTLALIGGGSLFAATAGFGYSVTRPLDTALAPWNAAGDYADPRMKALSWAILAPNPHNRQPWLVDLREPNVATLYVDTDRLLPHTDPMSRQIVIGLGCFLELARLAALEEGMAITTDLFPEGWDASRLDHRPVARMTFAPTDQSRDPLFAQVPHRRSLKEPYDLSRPVPAEALTRIEAAAQATTVSTSADADFVARYRELTRKALEIEVMTPHTFKESVDLFRIGRREVEANPDGIDFSGPMFETMGRVGLFTREAAADMTSTAFQQGMAAVEENALTAMAYVWQVTPGNSRLDQIAAGRDWLRLNLATTEAGLGMQPMSQALQEYPEMSALYAQVQSELAPQGGTVQMLARLGYGPEVGPSPRWPLDAKVLNG